MWLAVGATFNLSQCENSNQKQVIGQFSHHSSRPSKAIMTFKLKLAFNVLMVILMKQVDHDQ